MKAGAVVAQQLNRAWANTPRIGLTVGHNAPIGFNLNNAYSFQTASSNAIGIRFLAGADTTLAKAGFYCSASAGTAGNTLTIELRAESSGVPGALITNGSITGTFPPATGTSNRVTDHFATPPHGVGGDV